MERKYIIVKGARKNNLKNITVKIPRNKLVVITGVSGSGKSSLAFDTIYAEGQRRYVESLSTYARQFLGVMEKPDVEFIEGLSPTIAIEQRKIQKNPRSTVATTTEIYDYLRLLFARVGKPYCPYDNILLQKWSIDEIVEKILRLPIGTKITIMAPVVRLKKGEYKKLFERYQKMGFNKFRIDGEIFVDEIPEIDKNKKHNIDVIIDRIVIREEVKMRVFESVELALKEANGLVIVEYEENGELKEQIFSQHLACPKCEFSLSELEPRLFSFNSPYGACPECHGLGYKIEIDPSLLIIDENLSIMEGVIEPLGEPNFRIKEYLMDLAKIYNVSLKTPWKLLPDDFKNAILYGTINYSYWEGVIPYLYRRYNETESEYIREEIEKYMIYVKCPSCSGSRLRNEALSIKINGINIWEFTKMSVRKAYEFLESLTFDDNKSKIIAEKIVKEIKKRLKFLMEVGLDYLTLDRMTESLSGGEEQRVRLATQIGSGLVSVIYILDEPSIGLHPRDTQRLINTLKYLRNLGNTVIVVEHDENTIRQADWIIDLGPEAGDNGGYVVAQGKPSDLEKFKDKSLTAKYLCKELQIAIPESRRKPKGQYLKLYGARGNNLKNVNLSIPLGLFVVITGVSGSGKSSLIIDTLYKALKRELYNSKEQPLPYDRLEGLDYIDKVINVDQSPIGRTPRSNPATYTGVFTDIREVFALTREAKARGYNKGRFSFNKEEGRCNACQGEGYIKVEMYFLPDIYVPCDVCKGKRYNSEVLEVKYRGKNIADVLDMSVSEALKFFEDIHKIYRKLKLLEDVGLGYIKLGQPATTLSGGEAQRIKLARELNKIDTGKTLYILDEPTTGLHFDDVRKLINVLQRLVDKGNTVIVIEHNLDVIKSADWVIDLGPEGGDDGGYIVAQGTPEEISENKNSWTGYYLRKVLEENALKF
ncbi:MAG: excinuclease ABC subunit UvrA [candidate division WOR-3 bacterium]